MIRPGIWEGYDPDAQLPLGGYFVLVLIFSAFVGGGLLLLKRRGFFDDGKPLTETIGRWDFALLAVAVHQITWTIGRDRVLAPFRAAFALYKSSGGVGELNEVSRGSGLQMAIGDLLTCPYCLGPWIAAALLFAFFFAPRVTRLIATIFVFVAISNVLHQLYTILHHAASLTAT